jgi:hypothetical protein
VHASPSPPQTAGSVPGRHVAPPQQPPLQAVWLASPQVVSQLAAAVRHDWFAGQSAAAAQPQAPAMQACPIALPAQSEQLAPSWPQASAAVPATHVPWSQQPPRQTV